VRVSAQLKRLTDKEFAIMKGAPGLGAGALAVAGELNDKVYADRADSETDPLQKAG
jgi:hypothetical protein